MLRLMRLRGEDLYLIISLFTQGSDLVFLPLPYVFCWKRFSGQTAVNQDLFIVCIGNSPGRTIPVSIISDASFTDVIGLQY